jgi:hypothetical protein
MRWREKYNREFPRLIDATSLTLAAAYPRISREPKRLFDQYLEVPFLKIIERDGQRNKHIQRGIAHHRRAGR